MAADPEEAELRALLGTAEAALARAVAEAGLEPGIAAAACAALAGEYAAVFAAGRRLPPRPVLEEAARVLRRRGEAAHGALRPGEEASGAEEVEAGARVRSPRRRPSRAGHEADAAEGSRPGTPPSRPWPPFWRWRRFLGLPRGGRDGTP